MAVASYPVHVTHAAASIVCETKAHAQTQLSEPHNVRIIARARNTKGPHKLDRNRFAYTYQHHMDNSHYYRAAF